MGRKEGLTGFDLGDYRFFRENEKGGKASQWGFFFWIQILAIEIIESLR